MAYGRQRRFGWRGLMGADPTWSGVPRASRGISANVMSPGAKQSMIGGNMAALSGSTGWLENLNQDAFWTAMAEQAPYVEETPSAPPGPGSGGRQMGSFEAGMFDVGTPELASAKTGIMDLPFWKRPRRGF